MNEKFLSLVDAALKAFPALAYKKGGSRAHSAVEMIEAGKVAKLDDGQFRVDGHTCSIRRDECECKDHEFAAPFVNGKELNGRLCKHRVAAHWWVKTGGGKNLLLNVLVTQYAEVALTGAMKLVVYRDYTSDQFALVGIDQNGMITRLAPQEQIACTWVELRGAVQAAGFTGLKRAPEKLNRMEYVYHFVRDGGVEMSEGTMLSKGQTDAMLQRSASRKMLIADLAINGVPDGYPVSAEEVRQIIVYRMTYRSMGLAEAMKAIPTLVGVPPSLPPSQWVRKAGQGASVTV